MSRWACVAWWIGLAACGRVGFEAHAQAGDGALADTRDTAPADTEPADTSSDGPPADPSLLFQLAFDGSDLGTDSSAAHRHATCTNCPTPTAGIHGGAAAFDGSQCLAIADAPDLHPAAFTAAAWIFEGSAAQDGDYFTLPFHGATDNNNTWELVFSSGPPATIAVAVEAQDINVPLGSATGWAHTAIASDGSSYTLYINGGVRLSDSTTTLTYGSDAYRIGCDFNTGAEATPYIGALDDVRLYNRILSAAEIAALAAP